MTDHERAQLVQNLKMLCDKFSKAGLGVTAAIILGAAQRIKEDGETISALRATNKTR